MAIKVLKKKLKHNSFVYAITTIEYGENSLPNFVSSTFEKDPQKIHYLLTSRYENGALTDENQRDFYSVDIITLFVPCVANRE